MKTTLMFPAERSSAVKMAGKILRAGGLVAMPTETVYGLAADAMNEKAVEHIFKAKGRPQDNPLILHISSPQEIEPLVKKIPPIAEKLIEQYWPGPLTLVFKRSEAINNRVSAGLPTIAIRCPNHPAALRLIESAGTPLAAPSANISGKPSPTTVDHVLTDMNGKIDAVVDGGPCEIGIESTVLDISGEFPVLLRPGGIAEDELRLFLPDLQVFSKTNGKHPGSPGMRHRHYAPRAPFSLIEGSPTEVANFIRQKAKFSPVGAICFSDEEKLYDGIFSVTLGDSTDAEKTAFSLFDSLREADSLPVKQLYARLPDNTGLWASLRDRLIRAAGSTVLTLE